MKRSKRLLALGLVGCLLTLAACGKEDGKPSDGEEKKATAIEVHTVESGDMAAQNTVAGQVTAVEAVQVFPRLAGEVTALHVSEGDLVKKGQVLFQVDTSAVTATLGALQQSYAATKAATDQAIASAGLGAQQAQIAVDQATTALDNARALFEVGAASSQQVTQAEQAVQKATAGLHQAQGGVQQATASQAATLAQIQASITQIETQAGFGTVTAPVTGKVTSVDVTLGGMAAQSAPAVTIAAGGQLMVTVQASEAVRGSTSPGEVAEVVIGTISPEPMRCAVRSVSASANPSSRLYEITLYLPESLNPPIGAFADVTLLTDRRADTIQIPTESILTDGSLSYVFTVDGETAAKAEVETGLVGDGVTEIVRGLAAGDTLVIKGQSYLSDGAPVRVVNGEA